MTLTCRSYAKINLTLDIVGRRSDGFHEVRTILQTIDLHDTLRFESTARDIEIVCAEPSVPRDEQNLAHRAASAVRKHTGVTPGVRIEIIKNIPVAAGLGGGSSNAAVTLLALQKLWGSALSPRERLELASTLGADVPFFLYGGTAVGIGRGSEVYPLPDLPLHHLLLVNLDIRISTRDAYRAYSQSAELTKQSAESMIPDSCVAAYAAWGASTAGARRLLWSHPAGNDLEAAMAHRHPEIHQMADRLRRLGATRAMMSGSGSTVLALFENERQVERAAAALAGQGERVIRARTVGRTEYGDTLFHSSFSAS